MQGTRDTRRRSSTSQMLNHLKRGLTYQVKTSSGHTVSGEYLGTEVTYGNPAILLRHSEGTTAIHTNRLAAVVQTD